MREKPICGTDGCNNIALGVFNRRWRCGECIIRFDNKMKELKEKYFEKEEEK